MSKIRSPKSTEPKQSSLEPINGYLRLTFKWKNKNLNGQSNFGLLNLRL